MRKTYRLRSWKGWDKHVDACAREFLAEFGVAPNVLVASPVTLRRINVAADKAHLGNKHGEVPDSGAYVQIGGFAGDDYQLMFIEEDDVPENSFSLIHAFNSQEELEAAASG
jgi:hypothetical protein